MAQAALDMTVGHVRGREAFGGTLSQLQSVAHKVAEMSLEVEASRLLVYRAAALIEAGADRAETTRASAMAKLLATEVAQKVVDAAVQLHGAAALRAGHPLERLYRDVRAPRIYEGASEVQLEIIARGLLRD
jgi:alkylation response protein AidB-like acyl-CoA dehydrogenase